MDGTLTLPHLLDFDRMREASGLAAGTPILQGIESLPTPEQRQQAWAAIEAIELESPPALQPGLVELVSTLRALGVRMGIATRNNPRAVNALCAAAGLPADTFDPVLTREGPHPDKPHPAVAHAACERWGLPPSACLFVGDSLDDMRCGRAAGMSTCLLTNASPPSPTPTPTAAAAEEVEPLVAPAPLADEVDFAVATLGELHAMVDDAVLPE